MSALFLIMPKRCASRPRVRFSRTVRSSTTLSSWYRAMTPRAMASRTVFGSKGRPSNRISPLVLSSAPVRILIMVDLPEPFSPMTQCTVLRWMSKLTSLSA